MSPLRLSGLGLLLMGLLLGGCARRPTLTQGLPTVPATALVGSGQRLCFTGRDGVVYGLDGEGATKWTFSQARVSTKYPPVLAGSTVCVLSGDSVVALELASGRRLWSRACPGAVGPGTAGDDYILAQGNNQLSLLRASTGQVVKRITLGGHPAAGLAPVGLSDRVYCVRQGPPPDPEDRFAVQQVGVHALLVPSLEEVWRQETEAGPAMAVGDELLAYFKNVRYPNGTATEGLAWDRKSGRQRWHWTSGLKSAAVASRAAERDATIWFSFTTGLDAFVVAVQDREQWRTPLPANAAGSVSLTPVAVSGELLLVGVENRLLALDRTTGKRQWEADELEGKVVSAPLVLDHQVYLATDRMKLYAFKL